MNTKVGLFLMFFISGMARLVPIYSETMVVIPRETTITDTSVLVKNTTNDTMFFALAAIHTTPEKTPMYSRLHNAYVTQSIISELAEVQPNQTINNLSINQEGKAILERERTFAIIIMGVKRTSSEEIRKICSKTEAAPAPNPNDILSNLSQNPNDGSPIVGVDKNGNRVVLGYYRDPSKATYYAPGVNICQVYDDQLTVTEETSTWISNPKVKQVFYKNGPIKRDNGIHTNMFEFPQDFIFDRTESVGHTTPNYQKVIDNMKAVEKKYNKTIFPVNYFNIDTLKQLPLKELSNVSAYAYNMLNKPLPVTQATLGTLLDCGKYNGIAGVLVKIAMAIVLAVVSGGSGFSLIQDLIDNGMEMKTQITDLKGR